MRTYSWITQRGAATITGRVREEHAERVVDAIRDRYDRENARAKVLPFPSKPRYCPTCGSKITHGADLCFDCATRGRAS